MTTPKLLALREILQDATTALLLAAGHNGEEQAAHLCGCQSTPCAWHDTLYCHRLQWQDDTSAWDVSTSDSQC